MLFFSEYFRIRDIRIIGEVEKIRDEIVRTVASQQEKSVLIIGRQNNIFLFKSRELENSIAPKYYFSRFEVKKKLPKTIEITFKQKEYYFIWQEEGRFWYIDRDGIIIEEVNPTALGSSTLPLIINLTGRLKGEQSVNVDPQALVFIDELARAINDEPPSSFKPAEFEIRDTFNLVAMKTLEGPEIYLNYTRSASDQLEKLKAVIASKLKENFPRKKYIDLRYGDMIYTK